MRPLRLTLAGFTAFRDEQVIDFEGLDLFAITGPTGSGKSSILDAMTCALYGKADRVGIGVRQFIALGQPRASVSLEFAVGPASYRVTRRWATGGGTKILLEQLRDGAWSQVGEGADRVRSVDDEIERLVGLDYMGFTRAVLLPQGKFAEFLTGDARERRTILTELLDLGLFGQLAARAGETAREAKNRADALRALLEREYAGVTPEELEGARREERSAASGLAELVEAQERIALLVKRDAEGRAAAAEARRRANAAAQVRDDLAKRAGRFRDLADAIARADETVAAARGALKSAETALAHGREELAQADHRAGGVEGLAAARSAADGLAREGTARRELERRRHEAVARLETLTKALETARAAERDAGARAGGAREAQAATEAALERAQAEDRVAALSEGLAVGSPCPVCDRVLEAPPRHVHAPDLKAARAAAEAARTTADSATAAAGAAGGSVEKAAAQLEAARTAAEALDAEVAACEERIAGLRETLEAHFAGELPDDPAAGIAAQLAELGAFSKALDARRAEAEATRRALEAAERDRDAAAGHVREERARLDGQLAALRSLAGMPPASGSSMPAAERAAGSLVGAASEPSTGPLVGATVEPGSGSLVGAAEPVGGSLHAPLELASLAEAGSAQAASLAERSAAEASDLEAGATSLLAEGRAMLTPLAAVAPRLADAPGAGSVGELAGLTAAARATAERAAATAENRVRDLEERLARRGEMEADLASEERRARTYAALAAELRGDRIVTFLQEEALGVLADAGSEHLGGLSDGRYRLEVDGDDFVVVDGWNGDERRSVRTLSGGETFLASLALARALSEQVSTLSSGGRARLESLFLDEGFGTLDAESLELVIGAISNLGSDGRLVGVVTHVRELAERLPTCIRVEKSPRGSRIVTESPIAVA